jgi:predicted ATPase
LRLYGEQEYMVSPLAQPDPRVLLPAEILTQYEAVRLFVERARAVKADFSVTNENAPAVAEICARLDGLPLAIELAAARIRVLPPHKMLERLGYRLKLLRGGARDLPTRQQTLRGTIDWSYELLEEDEKTLFGRLSVFSGGRTLEAIEEICDPEGDLEVLEEIESLAEKSLLRQEEGPDGESRFVMLETVHEYAREKLEESGEAEGIKRAHAQHFLALAEEAEPELNGPDQLEWLERLEAEHDNMRAALAWALEFGETELALRLGNGLWWFWYVRGHISEGRVWLEAALEGDGDVSVAERAWALTGAGVLMIEQHDDLERATALLEEALALSRDVGDRWTEAGVLSNLATAAIGKGDHGRAADILEAGEKLYRSLGDRGRLAPCLANQGYIALIQGDHKRARKLIEESLVLARETEDKWMIAMALANLGFATLHYGDHEQAAALLLEGLELGRELGDKMTQAECLEGLACVAATRGEAPQTAQLFGVAEVSREAMGVPLPPEEHALREPYMVDARSRLDGSAWENAWEQGRSMSLDEAVSYALEEGEAGG